MRQINRSLAALAGAAMLVSAAAAQPGATAFTYQGELLQEGVPANGTFDMLFVLFNSPTSAVQLGGAQCADDVQVVDGRFAAVIDMGNSFDGGARYLEIHVRAGAGVACGSGPGFALLSPRQHITSTPQAMFSLQAASTSALNGQPASFYSDAGNLSSGILPDSRLSSIVARTNANQTFTGILNLSNAANVYAGSGSLLSSLNASNISIGTLLDTRLSSNIPRLNQSNSFGAFDNLFAGRVGIGSGTPRESLDVNGNAVFNGGVAVGTTSSPRPGTIRFNAAQRRFEGYTGGWWVALSATTIAPTIAANYATNGVYNFTVPAGVYSLAVDGWGAGGGGGGSAGGTLGATCGSNGPGGGGGGGSGAYGMSILEVAPGEVITVIVGSGGAGGPAGQNGVAGGITRVVHRGVDVLNVGGGVGGRQGNTDPILNGGACPPSPTSGSGGGVGGSVVVANAGSTIGNFGQNGSAPYNLGGCGFPNFPDIRAGCGGSRGSAVSATSPLGGSAGQGGLGGVWLTTGGPGSAGAAGTVRIFY